LEPKSKIISSINLASSSGSRHVFD
jgi:hypothetical protein